MDIGELRLKLDSLTVIRDFVAGIICSKPTVKHALIKIGWLDNNIFTTIIYNDTGLAIPDFTIDSATSKIKCAMQATPVQYSNMTISHNGDFETEFALVGVNYDLWITFQNPLGTLGNDFYITIHIV